jgi:hypothetical protein
MLCLNPVSDYANQHSIGQDQCDHYFFAPGHVCNVQKPSPDHPRTSHSKAQHQLSFKINVKKYFLTSYKCKIGFDKL